MFENVLFLLSTYYTNNCRPFYKTSNGCFLDYNDTSCYSKKDIFSVTI